ncbi:MAG: hypothetical protein HGB35_00785 [Geobacteraceae bacterium]|nr:hypothetical protein [Geobacteraceae bacterium]
MIKLNMISKREKYIFIAVAVVVSALVLDFGVQAWRKLADQSQARAKQLQQQWDYTSAMLNRSASIEANYNDVRSRYEKLFESNDPTRAMADLDAVAKAAGIQVDMIRPVQGEKNNRYELSLRGSWTQIMKFLQEAEGQTNLFEFPLVRIHRQEPSGELIVSAQAERTTL